MSTATALRSRTFRTVAVAVIAGGLLLSSFGGNSASAQSIEELRARAQAIASQLEVMREQEAILGTQMLQVQESIAATRQQIDETKAAIEDAKGRLGTAKAQASQYLVSAYMGAGVGDDLSVGATDPNQAVNEKVLLDTLQGDREQVAEDLRAAQLDLEQKTADLETVNAQLAAQEAELANVKVELDRTIAGQEELLADTTAELRAAIAAEEERRRRAAEAQARAMAMAAAQQQAAAQQAAAQQGGGQQGGGQQQAVRQGGATRTTGGGGGSAAPAYVASAAPYTGSNAAIAAAMSKLGTPYRWGGTGNGGYDCSGLVMTAFSAAGKSLPRVASAQYAATQRIGANQAQAGDLVFWGGASAHHVGIYVGNGQVLHAPRTGDVVKVAPLYGNPTFGRVG
ncbi:MAG: NlpC/P60 family protein [Microthrixaceae bacterium]